jgi:hypothetical protein
VIEYARTVLGRQEAHSAEFDEACSDPAVIFMPEGSRTHMGGTMRLGVRATVLQTTDCHAARLYRPTGTTISERHRHRCATFLAAGCVELCRWDAVTPYLFQVDLVPAAHRASATMYVGGANESQNGRFTHQSTACGRLPMYVSKGTACVFTIALPTVGRAEPVLVATV